MACAPCRWPISTPPAPDPDVGIGENHAAETYLVPLALQAAPSQNDALQVFCTDYPTRDGSCIRDYVHVADLAQAHVQALDHLANNGDSIALNLGTGQGHSVLEITEAARVVPGRDIPVVLAERREGGPPVLMAVEDKTRSVLGWKPAYTDLEGILRHAWDWHYHSIR